MLDSFLADGMVTSGSRDVVLQKNARQTVFFKMGAKHKKRNFNSLKDDTDLNSDILNLEVRSQGAASSRSLCIKKIHFGKLVSYQMIWDEIVAVDTLLFWFYFE